VPACGTVAGAECTALGDAFASVALSETSGVPHPLWFNSTTRVDTHALPGVHRGYSATMLDSTHFAWLGARHGALVFDEVFVLSLLSPPPKTLPAVWPALEPPPMPLCHSTHAAWPARAKGKGKRLHSLEQQRCQQLEHKRQQAERSSPLGARSGLAGSGGDHSGGRHGSGYGSGCSESSVQCKRPKHDRHNSHSNRCVVLHSFPTPEHSTGGSSWLGSCFRLMERGAANRSVTTLQARRLVAQSIDSRSACWCWEILGFTHPS
jgi:hypothetical protein